MTNPLSTDYDDFDFDLFYDWDSTDLPAEVIKNAHWMLYVDEVLLLLVFRTKILYTDK